MTLQPPHSATYHQLLSENTQALSRILEDGACELASLAGYEFRGTNLPKWASLLGIRKFVKGVRQENDGGLRGYNRAVSQNGLEQPWKTTPKKPFGYYTVTSDSQHHPGSAFLDYGGNNPAYSPTRFLRDYVVMVEEDLFLGKAYMELAGKYIPVSWFVLERWRNVPDIS